MAWFYFFTVFVLFYFVVDIICGLCRVGTSDIRETEKHWLSASVYFSGQHLHFRSFIFLFVMWSSVCVRVHMWLSQQNSAVTCVRVCIFFPLFSHRDPAQSCSSPLPACRYHSIHRSLCHCTFLHPPYLQRLLPTLLLHLHSGFIHLLMSNFHSEPKRDKIREESVHTSSTWKLFPFWLFSINKLVWC